MSNKIVSQLGVDDYFVCPVVADESPLEPGVFLIPGGAIDADPPVVPEGQRARWLHGSWVLDDLCPAAIAAEVTPSDWQPVDYRGMRAEAYRDESDPLFFKSQRGDVGIDAWLDKVAEIKARYPAAV